MANSPDQQLKTMLENIPEKTGRSLEDWKLLISKTDFSKHGQILKFLKSEHSITHGFANLIAAKYLENDEESDLVERQYSGAKADLRPIYEQILKAVQALGNDIEVSPKKASVSLRRKKQFALIVPATKNRIDLGLALKGEAAVGKLQSYNAMCSHKISLQSLEDFDQEVEDWLKEAYSRCG